MIHISKEFFGLVFILDVHFVHFSPGKILRNLYPTSQHNKGLMSYQNIGRQTITKIHCLACNSTILAKYIVRPTTIITWLYTAANQHQQNTFVRAATTNSAAVLHKQLLLGFVLCRIGHKQQALDFALWTLGHQQSGQKKSNSAEVDYPPLIWVLGDHCHTV